jgi:hypothetical protein
VLLPLSVTCTITLSMRGFVGSDVPTVSVPVVSRQPVYIPAVADVEPCTNATPAFTVMFIPEAAATSSGLPVPYRTPGRAAIPVDPDGDAPVKCADTACNRKSCR